VSEVIPRDLNLCVAGRCNVLQRGTVFCSVLQCVSDVIPRDVNLCVAVCV